MNRTHPCFAILEQSDRLASHQPRVHSLSTQLSLHADQPPLHCLVESLSPLHRSRREAPPLSIFDETVNLFFGPSLQTLLSPLAILFDPMIPRHLIHGRFTGYVPHIRRGSGETRSESLELVLVLRSLESTERERARFEVELGRGGVRERGADRGGVGVVCCFERMGGGREERRSREE